MSTSIFQNANNFTIQRANFMNASNGKGAWIQHLSYYVAQGATHQSKDQYDAPKCHPETRKQLLSDIKEWIEIPEKETGIMYLHGPAGAGKSCISRSVCEDAADAGLLGGSFFFWRGSPDRNHAQKLVTTLVYQLAMLNRDLANFIASEIERDPQIVVDKPLEYQFEKLVLEPIRSIPSDQLSVRAIVIDGLDECVDKISQISILHLLAKAVRHDKFPLGFIITSRPEVHLQEALDTKEIIFATQLISLSHIPAVAHDIRTTLQSGFSRIINDRRFKVALKSIPRPWPTFECIEKLVERSSGQFIYAATVMKFISSCDHNPASRLDIVLGIRESNNNSPYTDLDLLYLEILSRVKDAKRMMKVLGYILAIQDFAVKYSTSYPKDLSKVITQVRNTRRACGINTLK
ncbi:hypothetical protein BDQ17DRAFT_1328666 [Cyathus striatus]|nr:hypothetical protein BDQ17DRAFT_1328666 [Cyathus striatus]